jgi:hypothetical protein
MPEALYSDVSVEYYDWANRPAVIMDTIYGFAIIDWAEGWRPLRQDSTRDVWWNAYPSTAEELRETYGRLPSLPSVKDHPDYNEAYE